MTEIYSTNYMHAESAVWHSPALAKGFGVPEHLTLLLYQICVRVWLAACSLRQQWVTRCMPVLLGHASLALGNAGSVAACNEGRIVLTASSAARAPMCPLPASQIKQQLSQAWNHGQTKSQCFNRHAQTGCLLCLADSPCEHGSKHCWRHQALTHTCCRCDIMRYKRCAEPQPR